MSAINPASFVTPPSAGLPGPGGISNPLYCQDASHAERRHHQHDGRGFGGPRDTVDAGRDGMVNPVGMLRTTFPDSYQPFAQPSRQPDVGQPDPFGPYSPTSFGPMETGFSDYTAGSAGSDSAARIHPAQTEWTSRFQGLSLNS